MPSVRRIDHLAADRPGAHRCDRLGDLGPGGQRFAIVPMADRQVYCTATGTATATSPAGVRYSDDAAELQRRFGRWHDPIPQITAGLTPGQVLHHAVFDLVDQPAALHHGRVALVGDAAHAMTPSWGQGGCLAVEDAVTLSALVEAAAVHDVPIALARYTAARRPEPRGRARRSRRTARVTQAHGPVRTRAALHRRWISRGWVGCLIRAERDRRGEQDNPTTPGGPT